MAGGVRYTHDGLSGHIVGVHVRDTVGIFEEVVTTDTLGRRTGPRMRHTIEEKLRIVEEARAKGASVAMVDCSFPSRPQHLEADLGIEYICDISHRGRVEATFREATTNMGGLDGLVNVAGVERRHCAESG